MNSSFVNLEVIKDETTGEVVSFNIEGAPFTSVSPEQEQAIITNIETLEDALDITSSTGIIQVKTTAEWNATPAAQAPKGAIIVYSDYKTITVDQQQVPIAGIKISDGLAYIVDLPFITSYLEQQLTNHIADNVRHITANERTE